MNTSERALGIEDGDLAGRVCLVVQQGGQHPDLGGLRPAAAGLRGNGEGDEPGDGAMPPFRAGVPGLAARRVRMPPDSCSMTSSEPSGSSRMVLKGTDFAGNS